MPTSKTTLNKSALEPKALMAIQAEIRQLRGKLQWEGDLTEMRTEVPRQPPTAQK